MNGIKLIWLMSFINIVIVLRVEIKDRMVIRSLVFRLVVGFVLLVSWMIEIRVKVVIIGIDISMENCVFLVWVRFRVWVVVMVMLD